jgi:hypothetical protein
MLALPPFLLIDLLIRKFLLNSYMPCKDITDEIEIILDNNDCLNSYKLTKKTCGRQVTSFDEVEQIIVGMHVDKIVDLSIHDLIISNDFGELEYLFVKHIVAVQSGLKVMLGHDSGTVEDFCAMVKIEQTETGTAFEANIDGTGLKKAIKSCSYYTRK